MAFKKGVSGNPSGRPRGRKKNIIYEMILRLIENNLDAIEHQVKVSEPREKVEIIKDLAALVLPTKRLA